MYTYRVCVNCHRVFGCIFEKQKRKCKECDERCCDVETFLPNEASVTGGACDNCYKKRRKPNEKKSEDQSCNP